MLSVHAISAMVMFNSVIILIKIVRSRSSEYRVAIPKLMLQMLKF